MPLGRITAGKVLFGLILLVFVAYVKFGSHDTSSPRATSDSSISQTTSPMTPLQKKVKEAAEYWEKEKKAEVAWPERVRSAEAGVTTTIVGPGASWPCTRSKADLKVLMKWYKISLADPDGSGGEAAFSRFSDLLVQGHGTSIMLEPRDRVKILAIEPGIRKVAVVQKLEGGFAGSRAVTAQGCWIAAEVVTR